MSRWLELFEAMPEDDFSDHGRASSDVSADSPKSRRNTGPGNPLGAAHGIAPIAPIAPIGSVEPADRAGEAASGANGANGAQASEAGSLPAEPAFPRDFELTALMALTAQRDAEKTSFTCRHCGEPVDWTAYSLHPAVAFADGMSAHLACYEAAEIARIQAAAMRAVEIADEAETLFMGELP